MKKTSAIKIACIALCGLVCVSATTLSVEKKLKVKAPEGFAFIPMGSCDIGGKTVSVQAFYMSITEVSNKEYRMFLADLKAKGKTEALKTAQIDTMRWGDAKMKCTPYITHYYAHPAYDNYPVVNISHEGAQLYCEWLSEKLCNATQGKIKYQCRLPKKEEWIWAGRGGLQKTPYAWSGPYLRNKKGILQCNFMCYGPENIHYNPQTKTYEIMSLYQGVALNTSDNADITAPVKAYWTNGYGLYTMCGNVAEMIAEKGTAMGGSWQSTGYDVRIESEVEYTQPSPTVGFRPVITLISNES